MKRQRRIKSFEPGPQGLLGTITWDDDTKSKIDLTNFISYFRIFAPMHADPDRFKRFEVESGGRSIDWGDDMEIAATTLRRIALEQAGETMPIPDFIAWRERNGLSQEEAAKALGLNRRQIINYEMGRALIPKAVLLATRGYDATGIKDAVVEADKVLETTENDLARLIKARDIDALTKKLTPTIEAAIRNTGTRQSISDENFDKLILQAREFLENMNKNRVRIGEVRDKIKHFEESSDWGSGQRLHSRTAA